VTASVGAAGVASPRAKTEERILRVHAAGFGRRLVAALIDLAIVAAFGVAVALGIAFAVGAPLPNRKQIGPDWVVAGLVDGSPMAWGGIGLAFALALLYQLYFGGVAGQTLGKRVLGLRVISTRGDEPGPLRGFMRFLAMVVSLAPAGLGFLWALFDRERRALHDHLAGTYVILDR